VQTVPEFPELAAQNFRNPHRTNPVKNRVSGKVVKQTQPSRQLETSAANAPAYYRRTYATLTTQLGVHNAQGQGY
jgi:hypothetical protein